MKKKSVDVVELIARTKPEEYARVVAKMGRPKKQDDERRSVKVYVCCRAKDRGVALRDALRAARDAFERRADAQPR